jgi:hypothetical protein
MSYREWVDGPRFVDWLYKKRPELHGNAVNWLGQNHCSLFWRAKNKQVSIHLDEADKICCILDIHIDAELPEDIWVTK